MTFLKSEDHKPRIEISRKLFRDIPLDDATLVWTPKEHGGTAIVIPHDYVDAHIDFVDYPQDVHRLRLGLPPTTVMSERLCRLVEKMYPVMASGISPEDAHAALMHITAYRECRKTLGLDLLKRVLKDNSPGGPQWLREKRASIVAYVRQNVGDVPLASATLMFTKDNAVVVCPSHDDIYALARRIKATGIIGAHHHAWADMDDVTRAFHLMTAAWEKVLSGSHSAQAMDAALRSIPEYRDQKTHRWSAVSDVTN